MPRAWRWSPTCARPRRSSGGILVIDHDLGFISRICDHVIVLAEGRVLAEGTPDEIRRNPDVAAAYLAREPTRDNPPPDARLMSPAS